MSYDNIKSQRQSTKLRLVQAFNHKCGICGYDKCISALEFHHVDPTKKDFNMGSSCIAQNKIVTEVKKCVMLCSNCHREVHDGITIIPDNIQRFDENFVDYKTIKYNNKCPVCGILKPKIQITCSKQCASKHRCKIEQDNYDLQDLYNKLGSFLAIANYIGNVSDVTVKKRMVLLNLL